MKTDKLFYRLFSVQPELLLNLAGMPAPYPKGYRQQALELKETGFRLDGLLRPPSSEWPFLFWETQFQAEVLDLVEMILVYKLPSLSREEIRKMLHLPNTDLQETRFYQEVFAEGRVEGRVEGKVEGKVEGRVEEGRSLILRLLNRRLGTLPAALSARIHELPLDRIETLGEALLDFQVINDLESWLREHS